VWRCGSEGMYGWGGEGMRGGKGREVGDEDADETRRMRRLRLRGRGREWDGTMEKGWRVGKRRAGGRRRVGGRTDKGLQLKGFLMYNTAGQSLPRPRYQPSMLRLEQSRIFTHRYNIPTSS
jgi:hypothetical protein